MHPAVWSQIRRWCLSRGSTAHGTQTLPSVIIAGTTAEISDRQHTCLTPPCSYLDLGHDQASGGQEIGEGHDQDQRAGYSARQHHGEGCQAVCAGTVCAASIQARHRGQQRGKQSYFSSPSRSRQKNRMTVEFPYGAHFDRRRNERRMGNDNQTGFWWEQEKQAVFWYHARVQSPSERRSLPRLIHAASLRCMSIVACCVIMWIQPMLEDF